MLNTIIKSCKQGCAIMAVLFLSTTILLPTMAQACSDGGGGGGGSSSNETDKPENNRVFDDNDPDVPDLNDFGGWQFDPIDTQSQPPMDPTVLTDLDKDIEQFFQENWESILYALDATGTVATFFIPGMGWFKLVLVAGKLTAFAMDEKKQAFAKKVLANFEKHQSRSGGIGRGAPVNK